MDSIFMQQKSIEDPELDHMFEESIEREAKALVFRLEREVKRLEEIKEKKMKEDLLSLYRSE